MRARRRRPRPPNGPCRSIPSSSSRPASSPCASAIAARRALDGMRAHLRAAARGLPRRSDLLALPRQRYDSVEQRLGRALLANTRAHGVRLARCSSRLQPRLLEARLQRTRDRLEALGRRATSSLVRTTGPRRARLERVAGRLAPQTLSARLATCTERLGVLDARARQAIARASPRSGVISMRAASCSARSATMACCSAATPWCATARDARCARQPLVAAGQQLDIELADGRIPAQALQGGQPPRPSPASRHRPPAAAQAQTRRRPGLAVLTRRWIDVHHVSASHWRGRRADCMLRPFVAPGGMGCRGGEGMNRFEKLLGLKGEAKLRYLDGEFQVLSPGDFVRCAVTGEPIMLPDLRYWSVELQEAYASAEISFERHRTVRARSGQQVSRLPRPAYADLPATAWDSLRPMMAGPETSPDTRQRRAARCPARQLGRPRRAGGLEALPQARPLRSADRRLAAAVSLLVVAGAGRACPRQALSRTSGISPCSTSAPSSCAAPAAPITTSSTATTTPASPAPPGGPSRPARSRVRQAQLFLVAAVPDRLGGAAPVQPVHGGARRRLAGADRHLSLHQAVHLLAAAHAGPDLQVGRAGRLGGRHRLARRWRRWCSTPARCCGPSATTPSTRTRTRRTT